MFGLKGWGLEPLSACFDRSAPRTFASQVAGRALNAQLGRQAPVTRRRGTEVPCAPAAPEQTSGLHDTEPTTRMQTQQRTTNGERRTTNNDHGITNNDHRTTNNEQRTTTTNNKQQTTDNRQPTTDNRQQTTDNRQHTTDN